MLASCDRPVPRVLCLVRGCSGYHDANQGAISGYEVALSNASDPLAPLVVNWTFVSPLDATSSSGDGYTYVFGGVSLRAGVTYHGMVRAVDRAGHRSETVVSSGQR